MEDLIFQIQGINTNLLIGLTFFIIVVGAVGYRIHAHFQKKNSKLNTILKKSRSLFQVIPAEVEVSSFYHYKENLKGLNFRSGVEAIVQVGSKVILRYDLSNILLVPNEEKKIIKITNIPEPITSYGEETKKFNTLKKGGNFILGTSLNDSKRNDIMNEATKHLKNKVRSTGIEKQGKKHLLKSISIINSIALNHGWQVIAESPNNKKESKLLENA